MKGLGHVVGSWLARVGSGHVLNSSSVLFLGSAVKATKVMPPSSVLFVFYAARMSSLLISPPPLRFGY